VKTDLKKPNRVSIQGLWDYFEQEARKSKISRGEAAESQSYTTIFFAAGFGIHSASEEERG